MEPANNQGWRVNAHEIKEGLIYEDKNIIVEAFPVVHGSWPNAYGFRITTSDKIIVISGDSRPCESIEKYSEGADILIHEVYSYAGWSTKNEFWKAYHKMNHTSTYELGDLASRSLPKLVVLYHTLYWGSTDEEILNEISEKYDGRVIIGHDLDVF